jgi:Protein of unknown function (DUF4231)
VDSPWARWAALIVSLIVAACIGIEGLFRFGNRWRLYRVLLDELRAEGWAYASQIGEGYGQAVDGDKKFRTFVQRIEALLDRYGEQYLSDILVLGNATPPRAAGAVTEGESPQPVHPP